MYPDSIPAEFDDAVLVLVPGESFVAQITSDLQSLGPAFSIRLLALLSDQDIALNSRISVFSTLVNLSDDPQAREVDDYVLAQRFGDAQATVLTGIYSTSTTLYVDAKEVGIFEIGGFRPIEPSIQLGGTGLQDCYDNEDVARCSDVASTFPHQDAARRQFPNSVSVQNSIATVGNVNWTFFPVDSSVESWHYGSLCEAVHFEEMTDWQLPSVFEFVASIDFEKEAAFSGSINERFNIGEKKIFLFEERAYPDNYFAGVFGVTEFSATSIPVLLEGKSNRVQQLGCAHTANRKVDDKYYVATAAKYGNVEAHLATGTVWAFVDTETSWQVALQYCDQLESGGRRNWVLANAKEIFALSVLRAFDSKHKKYWTSTTVRGTPSSAYAFEQWTYALMPANKMDEASVACVSVK